MKKRWIVIAIIIIALLIAATIFIIPMVKDTKPTSETSKVEEPIEDNDQPQPPSNLPTITPSAPVEVPEQVQEVINNNQDELYQDTSNLLASGYPSQLIPLYGATTVSESELITSPAGYPGWLTSFVSEKPTEELTSFYRSLLSSLPDFSEEMVYESTVFKASSGSYTIDLTVSPNIQEKTGLPGQSAASIYIEQVQ